MLSYCGEKVEKLKHLGVNDIIIDPGFGFGQTLEQNFFLMNYLEVLKELALPLLVGISRKSMIYKTLKVTPNEALAGTITLNTIALQKGANILRVHDVKAALDTIQIIETLKQNQ
jgi:dihydropteroate synthase